MPANTRNITFGKKAYPITVSISMIVAALLLSFVDLAFLNDVIGKLLDVGTTESIAVSSTLGLVGIAIMGHQGLRASHEAENLRNSSAHYILWLSLGLAFVMIRVFSATILQLDGSSSDGLLINILGIRIRQVDIVIAPLMFFLYLASGVIVKDGVENLLLNPEFEDRLAAWKEARYLNKIAIGARRTKAEEQIIKLRKEAERKQRQLKKEAEINKRKKQALAEAGRITIALNGNYSVALAQYRDKEKDIRAKYQKISSNIDFVKNIDKQQKEFELKVKPSLLSIVQASIYSTQNSIALAIRKKTGEDITNLRDAIESHNNN